MPTGAALSHLKTLVKSVAIPDNFITTAEGQSHQESVKTTHKNDDCRVETTNKRSISKKRWKSNNQSKVNASERERKGRLAASIKKLKDVLPVNPLQMQTKESVLEEALNYIFKLKEKVEDMLQKDVSEIVAREMEQLKKRVLDLEKNNKFYQMVLQSHGIPPVLNTNLNWKSKSQSKNKAKTNDGPKTATTSISGDSDNNFTPSSEEVAKTDTLLPVVSTPEKTQSNNTGFDNPNHKTSISTNTSNSPSISLSSHPAVSASQPATSNTSPVHVTSTVASSILFPPVNTLHYRTNRAVCISTYSQARIKTTTQTELPTLPSITAEVVRHITSPTSTSQSSTSTHCSSSKENSDAGNVILVSSCVEAIPTLPQTSENNESLSVSCSKTVTDEINSLLPASIATSTAKSTALNDTSTCNTETVKHSDASTTKTCQSPCASTCNNNLTVPESPAFDSHLLSWLRSCETPSVTKTVVPVSLTLPLVTNTQATTAAKTVSQNPSTPPKQSNLFSTNLLMTPSSKKGTNSFDIASLMRSKDAIPDDLSPVLTTKTTVVAALQQETQPKEIYQNEPEPTELNVETPKDIFHQSLENDLLDCLQNMPSLTTPEPPSRQILSKNDVFSRTLSRYSSFQDGSYFIVSNTATKLTAGKQKDTNISLDFNDLLQNEATEQPQCSALIQQKAIVSDQPKQVVSTHLIQSSAPILAEGNMNNKDRSHILPRFPPSNPNYFPPNLPNMNYFVSNAPTSLWQPAIASSAQISHTVANVPQMPDCFSPMAYQYLNTGAQRAAVQPSSTFTSAGSWMPPREEGNRFSSSLTKAPPTSQIASTSAQQRLEVPKKRRAARSSQSSKRKKSNAKPATKDNHTVNQLVGYHQYPERLPHHQQNQALPIPLAQVNISAEAACASEQVQANRRAFFGPTTNPPIRGPPCVGYNPEYQQANIFHSPPPMNHQAPGPYPAPHPGYFPYNHHPAQQPARQVYMPRFANANNNNNSIVSRTSVKPHKASQHHIRQILS